MELNFLEDCTEKEVSSVVHVTHVTVVAVMGGKVLYVKKRGKSTLELPSISFEKGELPAAAVRRLISEKLNAYDNVVVFISAYGRAEGSEVEYGVLYYADISSMRTLNDPELCSSYFLDSPPEDREKWTYPDTDIPLLNKAMEHIRKK